MNGPSMRRTVIIIFALTLVAYVGAFYGIERWRARKGPWQVDFTTTSEGRPQLRISQAGLHLDGVTLVFPEESAAPTNLTLRFDHPIKEMPWGTVVYQDPITFPGVVTMHLFGHEVELLPRTLSLNRRAVAWQNHSTNLLKTADKLPPDQLIRRKYQREAK